VLCARLHDRVCGVVALGLVSSAGAGPVSGSRALSEAADTALMVPVHGCHADWRDDRFGYHRHRRDCARVEAEPRYEPAPRVYEPPPRVYVPERRCWYVGPVRVCE
jgi:hypothetical protein